MDKRLIIKILIILVPLELLLWYHVFNNSEGTSDNNLEEILKRAKSNNVEKLLTICTTLESFEKIKLIIKNHHNIFGTFGIHPHETQKHKNVNLSFILNTVKENNKIVNVIIKLPFKQKMVIQL